MSFTSEKIKEYMRIKDISYSELEKITGISKATLFRYANEVTDIPAEKLKTIANALNVPLESLLDLPKNAFAVSPQGKLAIIGRVSAGNGITAEQEVIGYEYADSRYCNDGHFFLRVTGDSMQPRIEDGDLLLVRKQTSVDSGNIAVVMVDNEDGIVKRVNYGADWIELQSLNPKYPARRFNGADVLKVRVIGRVIEVRGKL